MEGSNLPFGPRKQSSSGPAWSRDELNAIIARLREGDNSAAIALLQRYETPLRRLAEYYGRRAHEDLFSACWLDFLELIVRETPEGSKDPAQAALCTLRNRMQTYARNFSERWIPLSDLIEEEPLTLIEREQGAPGNLHHAILDQRLCVEDPEREVVARVTVQDRLDRLKDDQRAIVIRHLFEGYSFEEIGVQKGKKASACRKTFQRARERLQHDLPRTGADSGEEEP